MANGERLMREIEYFSRHSQPVSLRKFAKDFSIAPSTAQLDIEELKSLGCIFEVGRGFHGGYKMIEAPTKINFVLTKEQVEVWNGIVEKSTDVEKSLLAYVMSIAETQKVSEL